MISKVYIKIDSNNNVIALEGGCSTPNDLTGWIQIDEGYGDKYSLCQNNYLSKPIRDIYHHLFNYAYVDGKIVEKDLTKEITKAEEKEELNNLRRRREIECFSIINRGSFWFKTLSDDQSKELENWYKSWLNVTETKIIPEKPEWLK